MGGSLTIEIQRTCGCSCKFNKIAKIVLKAASKGTFMRSNNKNKISATINRRSSDNINGRKYKKENQSEMKKNRDKESSILESINIARDMLLKKNVHTTQLGLDILLPLTNDTGGTELAVNQILACNSLVNALLLLLACNINNKNDEEIFGGAHRHTALIILASCIDIAEKSGNHASQLILRKNNNTFGLLVESLTHQLSSPSSKPYDAYQAIKCLQKIVGCSCFPYERKNEIKNCVAMLGQQRNAMLQKESSKLCRMIVQ